MSDTTTADPAPYEALERREDQIRSEIVLLERIVKIREQVAKATTHAAKAASASYTADRDEKRLRRLLVREEKKAGLITQQPKDQQ